MKKVSEKYTYIWTIFVGIPFGVGCLIAALNYFNTIPKDIDSLKLVTGKIVNYEEKEFYDKEIDTRYDVYYVEIENKILKTEIGEKRKILRSVIPNIYLRGEEISIWYENESLSIEQIATNDKIYIQYKPAYWKIWFFLIIGVVFTTMGTIYLIKYFKSTWYPF